ncbi:MAG: porin [Burkholderiaceae bacterium]|nr:porin [Burkholderiaceae bacterium]
MKKSLLALAVLGTFAGVASAQSSVTLFGIVDLNGRSIKNGSTTQKQQVSNSLNSNRLGFRGTEDLGGGMFAGFWLEGAMNNDSGEGTATGGGQNWQRRSTVSLGGRFGEIRLGRDYTPSFWNTTVFDPFGTNGVGSFLNTAGTGAITTATTYVRANNSFGYFLPGNLGGLYGQVQTSLGEGVDANKQTSVRIGWAGGPINIAVSTGKTDLATEYTHNNIAGSWNAGFANFMAQYDTQEAGAAERVMYLFGVVVPVGQHELKFSYVNSKGDGPLNGVDADQFALGYIYNLSKRTALYGHYAQIKNKGGAAFVVGAGPGNATNDKSTGYEVGLRHSF